MVEIFTLYGLVVGATAGNAWEKLPLIVSAIVGLVGVALAVQAKRDDNKKTEAKEKLDTLTIGQEWVVAALDRAEKDNERLRIAYVAQQHEFETEIRGWKKKTEDQEDEIISLKIEVAALKRKLNMT